MQAASTVEQASVEEVWRYAARLELELPELQHLLADGKLDELLLVGLKGGSMIGDHIDDRHSLCCCCQWMILSPLLVSNMKLSEFIDGVT